ncbi:UNVERIFIED_CONTAM: hypothetical protein GTU68_054430, partial [Idotea baltica]|nr:hypothetical protein [Idotea baltica]
IVVTGGCGFVGAHQVVAFLGAGHRVCIVDDLSNSSIDVIDNIREISGDDCRFEEFNVLDTARLEQTMIEFEAEAVIHLAGLKHVWESTKRPVEYFHTNLGGIGSVLAACKASGVRKLIFSSSGSIYGSTDQLPIVESQRPAPTNPYSVSKSMCETMLEDVCRYESDWSITALRYFNPAGAHPSGLIGENPIGQPSNLLPALVRSATTANPVAVVHGDDFDTVDGSGVRDYVHVMDVAESHIRALEAMQRGSSDVALNIGRGEGVSVYQMIEAVERAAQREFEIVVGPPRPGDVAALYGDTTKSTSVLGPIDYRSLEEICDDAWRWQSKHEAARS